MAAAALLLSTLLSTLLPAPPVAVADDLPAPTDHPLAGPWATYVGPQEPVTTAWSSATGRTRDLLATIVDQPRVKWFGAYLTPAQAGDAVRRYVADSQQGDPTALVQLATFRLWPRGEDAKDQPLTAADQAAYRAWVDEVALAIGDARAMVIVEPDLAVALKGWKPWVRLRLAAYAAERFAALPNTTAYLEIGDADWLPVTTAVDTLVKAGVAHTRGFALGATHYWSVEAQLEYGRQVAAGLAARGVPDKRFVVDTADNGRPFTWSDYYRQHPSGVFDNAEVCRHRSQRRCITLGVPPTATTAAPDVCDAYLWFGRPWMFMQAAPFDLRRALAVARTTPY